MGLREVTRESHLQRHVLAVGPVVQELVALAVVVQRLERLEVLQGRRQVPVRLHLHKRTVGASENICMSRDTCAHTAAHWLR